MKTFISLIQIALMLGGVALGLYGLSLLHPGLFWIGLGTFLVKAGYTPWEE